MIKNVNKLVLASLVGVLSLNLVACESTEEKIEKAKLVERQKAEKEAQNKLKEYKKEMEKKQTTPYTNSEMYELVGRKYKQIKEGISGFNKDIDKLKDEEITVYDLNKNVEGFSLIIKDLKDVDKLKVHKDYVDFYKLLTSAASDYTDNLGVFSDAYASQDTDTIKEVGKNISKNIEDIEKAEEMIFLTPLGDKSLTTDTKKELEKRFKKACKVKVDDENMGDLKDKQKELDAVDPTTLDEESFANRKLKQKELDKQLKEYNKKAVKLYIDCYQELIDERQRFGFNGTESENSKEDVKSDESKSKVKDDAKMMDDKSQSKKVENKETKKSESTKKVEEVISQIEKESKNK